jgi:hypothetical protein
LIKLIIKIIREKCNTGCYTGRADPRHDGAQLVLPPCSQHERWGTVQVESTGSWQDSGVAVGSDSSRRSAAQSDDGKAEAAASSASDIRDRAC